MSSITNMFAQSARESGAESAIETGKEEQCRISIYMREKLDKGLEKTEDALSKVQDASSKVELLSPLTRKLEQVTTWIGSKREQNQEKIEAEKEEGAWSTLGRIYHGSLAKVKAGAAVVTEVASKTREVLRSKNERQEVRNPEVASKTRDVLRSKNERQEVRNPSDYSRFNPMRLLSKVSMPQGSLPKLPEMPESNISMPQITVPSLPFGLNDKIVETIQDKMWDKVEKEVEEYMTDPIKKGQKSVEDLVEHYTGKQGMESMEAATVIFNHHTAEYQEKASGCYERAKKTVKQIPHWIASGCSSLFYGSAPTEPQPVTV